MVEKASKVRPNIQRDGDGRIEITGMTVGADLEVS